MHSIAPYSRLKKEPIQKDGGAASQIWLHFCPWVGGAKLRFASVEPSAAALVRAAFRWFKSGAAKKEPRPEGLGYCGKGSRDLII